MSRIIRCDCGFYVSFGHSSSYGFPWIFAPNTPIEEKMKAYEEGKIDPFYFFHTECPNCGQKFSPQAEEELFLPWEEFAQKILKSANIAVFTVSTKQRKEEEG